MLMDIKCSAVTSIAVRLTYDDNSYKDAVIALNDLIDVEYNANGLRKHACGKVVVVSAVGTDPKGWYIIVDSSDDFGSNKARFSPTSILKLEIITKGDSIDYVRTVKGCYGIPYMRIVKGRLQYSMDGCMWKSISIDQKDIIEDQEGTCPVGPDDPDYNHDNCNCGDGSALSPDDGIEDANW